jgi:hypothetical protein
VVFEKENQNLEDLAEGAGFEVVIDSISEFSGFRKENFEMVGIARVKEALECAVAGFISDLEEIPAEPFETLPRPSILPELSETLTHPSIQKPLKKDDLEADMENFEYFLSKIKETCEKSKTTDDETRRKNAELAILELSKYLSLDSEDESD